MDGLQPGYSLRQTRHLTRRLGQFPRSLFNSPRSLFFVGFACLLLFIVHFHLLQQSFPPATLSTTPPTQVLPSVSHFQVVTPEDKDASAYRTYKSSTIKPPHFNITHYGGNLADGLLFLTPRSREKRLGTMKAPAPYIFTTDGDLVYAHNRTNLTMNFRLQDIGGEHKLTFWQGPNVGGYGYGRMFTLDREYRQDVVKLNYSLQYEFATPREISGFMDFHEQQMTERGTLLVTGYGNVPMDLSHLPNGIEDDVVLDSMFFEIDVQTGEVLFSWSALQHVSINQSHTHVSPHQDDEQHVRPWDFFHINSIQALEEGYLVSSRHCWGVYLISKEDGHVIWKLDGSGTGGDFGGLAKDSQFRWQHHARAHNVTKERMEISIFDNHCTKEQDSHVFPSRGLLLEVKLPPHPSQEPVLLKTAGGLDEWYVDSQGSYNPNLGNGNQLLGFGTVPVVEEYGPDGDLRWQARFGVDFKVMSYRAYKKEWHAIPYWDPSLVVEEGPVDAFSNKIESMTAYVSWNGATDVGSWGVYVGNRTGYMTFAAKAVKKGFETTFEVMLGDNECVQVAAYKDLEKIGLSNKVCLGDGPIVFVEPFDEEYNINV